MQQIVDENFPFRDFNGRVGECRLRVFQEDGKPSVVIATELPDNPAMSVTNAAELLATQVYEWLERPTQGFVWIENYPEKEDKRLPRWEESFDLVTFTETSRGFIHPKWKYLTREEVERIIGQAL